MLSNSCLPWVLLFLTLPTSHTSYALGLFHPPSQPQLPSLHLWLPCLPAASASLIFSCEGLADFWMPPWTPPATMSQIGLSIFHQSNSSWATSQGCPTALIPGSHQSNGTMCLAWCHLSLSGWGGGLLTGPCAAAVTPPAPSTAAYGLP